ncbi:hypothetical protein NEIELOOT_00656 [Neisseria elongata subsp. glycolytica ATCC 29315]|uniref:Uncharacterized protein n=1 Tax=Neisseria elongata subsp. glycolytica ATCC 29315 TaxID=546263 RepID=D4DNM3_NEIEG|nr:hypothetical protein NEIELOOT_00656 [Neisseria elongata subsp. glycolytica ATCC 29315]
MTVKGFRRPIQRNRPSEDSVCKNEIKNQDGKIRHCLSDEYFGKSGTKLTTEIEDGLHLKNWRYKMSYLNLDDDMYLVYDFKKI